MLRCAITDGTLSFASGNLAAEALARRCAELAGQGVELILLREKQLQAEEFALAGRLVLEAVRAASDATRVLVSSRVDVALAIGADGVNLSAHAGELRVSQVRDLMPQGFVSVSCHSLADVRRARETGASAGFFGPVFGKWVDGAEVVPGVGLEALREACAAAGEMPVLALGGVTAGNAQACVEAGAGVAGIRMFFPIRATILEL